MARIIDGKFISAQIKEELKSQVAALAAQGKNVTLAVILVGNDPASCVYVKNKEKACEYVGIRSVVQRLPEDTTQEALLAAVDKLNTDETVDGDSCTASSGPGTLMKTVLSMPLIPAKM